MHTKQSNPMPLPPLSWLHIPIKYLLIQTGIDVEVEGVTHHVKGTIALVSGDNLASQSLGGYKGLSSALRKCRQCMAVNVDMQTKVHVMLGTILCSIYAFHCMPF